MTHSQDSQSVATAVQPDEVPVEYEYRHDDAVIQASWIAISIQVCLAIAIANLFFPIYSPWLWPVQMGCILLEIAIGVLLYHCFFLFPKHSKGRFFPVLVCPFIALVQTAPISNGEAQGPLIAYCVGLFIAGWFLHRLFGASLTMRGEDVFQDAVGTKVLLLLAPLLLLMGLIPTLIVMWFGRSQPGQAWFATTIIYSSVSLLGLTLVPLLSIHALFWFVRMRVLGRIYLALVLSAFVVVCASCEWSIGGKTSVCLGLAAAIATYFLGLLIAYAPFHALGFRPVWAKRSERKSADQDVSFDEIT